MPTRPSPTLSSRISIPLSLLVLCALGWTCSAAPASGPCADSAGGTAFKSSHSLSSLWCPASAVCAATGPAFGVPHVTQHQYLLSLLTSSYPAAAGAGQRSNKDDTPFLFDVTLLLPLLRTGAHLCAVLHCFSAHSGDRWVHCLPLNSPRYAYSFRA